MPPCLTISIQETILQTTYFLAFPGSVPFSFKLSPDFSSRFRISNFSCFNREKNSMVCIVICLCVESLTTLVTYISHSYIGTHGHIRHIFGFIITSFSKQISPTFGVLFRWVYDIRSNLVSSTAPHQCLLG